MYPQGCGGSSPFFGTISPVMNRWARGPSTRPQRRARSGFRQRAQPALSERSESNGPAKRLQNMAPSLRSGFRRATQTPRKRLNFFGTINLPRRFAFGDSRRSPGSAQPLLPQAFVRMRGDSDFRAIRGFNPIDTLSPGGDTEVLSPPPYLNRFT